MEYQEEDKTELRYEDEEKLIDILTEYPKSKVYLGCDSVRYKKKGAMWAKYATIVAVHKNGHQGCKIFYDISHKIDYDPKGKPKTRMLMEAYKTITMHESLKDLIEGFDVEIHLDISTNPIHGSYIAAAEAAGFVLGMTGIEPFLKPESWAASFAADGIGRGFHERGN